MGNPHGLPPNLSTLPIRKLLWFVIPGALLTGISVGIYWLCGGENLAIVTAVSAGAALLILGAIDSQLLPKYRVWYRCPGCKTEFWLVVNGDGKGYEQVSKTSIFGCPKCDRPLSAICWFCGMREPDLENSFEISDKVGAGSERIAPGLKQISFKVVTSKIPRCAPCGSVLRHGFADILQLMLSDGTAMAFGVIAYFVFTGVTGLGLEAWLLRGDGEISGDYFVVITIAIPSAYILWKMLSCLLFGFRAGTALSHNYYPVTHRTVDKKWRARTVLK